MSVAVSQIPTSHERHPADCPACGASEPARSAWRFVNARGETEWLQCPSCQSYFMDREYSLESEISHTQQMTWGDSDSGERLNDFKQRMYHAILNRLRQYIDPAGKTLLDVGCSYGGFMEAAAAEGFRVTGYDIVPEAVERVSRAGMQAQCCGQISDFKLTDEPFDVISVLDANIYWPNQPLELAGIHQRLKPGGLLVMRVVDKSWMARIGAALQNVSPARGEKILRRAVNDHRFSMPVRSFLSLLEKSGFRIITASPRGAVHSDRTSLPVRISFAIGAAMWQTLGVFLAPGAVIIAEKE
ncbi:MAG: class I SAM-dependent methyltransferase [Planctomycetaceae bacterium]|nr:class I SAM-dependent methyltransferase [Planctomycetaceae bacterium]